MRIAQPDDPPALPLHQPSRRLAGNAPFALAQHMIDSSGNRRDDPCGFRRRLGAMKAVREFFGDEAGGELARLPARMRHQGGEERNVVADAVDREGIERIGLRGDRRGAGRTVGHQLGDHRIVIERNLAALGHIPFVRDRAALNNITKDPPSPADPSFLLARVIANKMSLPDELSA